MKRQNKQKTRLVALALVNHRRVGLKLLANKERR